MLVASLGVPSLQHPLGELQATAGLAPPAAGDAVVVAGVVEGEAAVLPPTMGVGEAAEDVEDAGAGLLDVEFAPPSEPTMPDTMDIACMRSSRVDGCLWKCSQWLARLACTS